MKEKLRYPTFFRALTGHDPFPYQERIAAGAWPDLLDIPTGLGKTAAVIVAWLWKRLHDDRETGRRLVYCLPMRTLVEQTRDAARGWCEAAAPFFRERALQPPEVAVLMGGETEASWDTEPGRGVILVGTQDMLLSRGLGRGYGMSRYRWPMHYGLLNSDCLWVFDETQLMGVGVETSAQLQAFRDALGTLGPARSLWMSATLGREQLATVDHPEPADGWVVEALSAPERAHETAVRERTLAKKHLFRAENLALEKKPGEAYYRQVAERVAQAARERGGLTLVVVNRVYRAQRLYRAVEDALSESGLPVALLHSRFRPPERQRHGEVLVQEGDRVVVSTQVVEAGVDVSATTLFTELAPWPSLVQRFGRCNRFGEAEREGRRAEIHWIPLAVENEGELALPYEISELTRARELLGELESRGGDAGPTALGNIDYIASPVVRPVLRRRDLLELFDTSPDLLGYDLDVSRFVRDAGEPDVQLFWRAFKLDQGRPEDASRPSREELCRVSVGDVAAFLKALDRLRRRQESGGVGDSERRRLLRPWRWDPLEGRWVAATRRILPGETLLLHTTAGGYDEGLGWTGATTGVVEASDLGVGSEPYDSVDRDPESFARCWVSLSDHLVHVGESAHRIAIETGLAPRLSAALVAAAKWHDVGKAHDQFQRRLLAPLAERPDHPNPGTGPWAKSDHRFRAKGVRPFFRHELASALVWLVRHRHEDPSFRDLVAFLIVAHHGKVRLGLRSLPGEEVPEIQDTPYARGVWHGDLLPAVELPGGESVPPTRIDLSPMQMGEGSWTEGVLRLRDDSELGPFRLAYLECLLRAADERASAAEQAAATREDIDA